jgi:biopolymer transport protein ExbB
MDTTTAATSTAENPYGLMAMVKNGDLVSRAVLLILVFMSLSSWYVMLIKLWDQRRLRFAAKTVEKSFWNAPSIKDGASRLPRGDEFRNIAEAGLRAAEHHDGRLAGRIDLHEWITIALDHAVGGVQSRLAKGLGLLATVGSVAPFVGLFGTVWGILNALTAIGLSGQASIDKVAGPVGEALIMTAFGLFVAVPAVMGYNWVLGRNKDLNETLRNYTSELHAYLVSGARIPTETAGGARPVAAPAAPVRK